MANWCSNNVTFQGEESNVKEVKALFNEIRRKEEIEESIWLPPYITDKNGYMVGCYIKDDIIHYRTRWSPNINVLIEVADEFEVSFISKYDELGMGIFGVSTYSQKELSETYIEADDLRTIGYDGEMFNYKNESYDSPWNIYEKIIERKFVGKSDFSINSKLKYEPNGDLPLFDQILQLAEHKNFENARTIFSDLDEVSIIEVDHFLHRNIKLNHKKYESRDKVLAVIFLKQLISDWKNLQQTIISQQHSHAQQR